MSKENDGGPAFPRTGFRTENGQLSAKSRKVLAKRYNIDVSNPNFQAGGTL